MKGLSIRYLSALVVGIFLLPTTSSAQSAKANVLSINPIGTVFSVYNLEFERGLSENVTFALSSTYWGAGAGATDESGSELSASYISGDLKGRYYPGGALNGFSFGGLIGVTSLGAEVRTCSVSGTCDRDGERAFALSGGVTLDYLALLGANKNIALGVGAGAKRLKPFEDEIDGLLAYPFARLTIGVAF